MSRKIRIRRFATMDSLAPYDNIDVFYAKVVQVDMGVPQKKLFIGEDENSVVLDVAVHIGVIERRRFEYTIMKHLPLKEGDMIKFTRYLKAGEMGWRFENANQDDIDIANVLFKYGKQQYSKKTLRNYKNALRRKCANRKV